MSKRYFVNRLTDYRGGEVKIDQQSTKLRCISYFETIKRRQGTSLKHCDGGLYVGVAGVAYACYYLAQNPVFEKQKQEFLRIGEEYIKHAVAYVSHPSVKSDIKMQPSFLLGAAGVYATAAALCDMVGRFDERNSFLRQYAALSDICLQKNFMWCGSDELFVGRAGYLCGVLFIHKTLRIPVLSREKVHALCQTIVISGREYAKSARYDLPLMYKYSGTEYFGAAHGFSSILQMLLSFPDYLDTYPESERYVKECVDFLLSTQREDGNFPCDLLDSKVSRAECSELVHWCHGAPGIVYLMVKAYQRWSDQKYLQSCLACGEITWLKGLLKKGPGICHGVAGNGYVFLLLYRLTGDPKQLHRASMFADFLFTDRFAKARTPDNPNSLYEGLAGTMCFLGDLMQPDKAKFPFFDVL